MHQPEGPSLLKLLPQCNQTMKAWMRLSEESLCMQTAAAHLTAIMCPPIACCPGRPAAHRTPQSTLITLLTDHQTGVKSFLGCVGALTRWTRASGPRSGDRHRARTARPGFRRRRGLPQFHSTITRSSHTARPGRPRRRGPPQVYSASLSDLLFRRTSRVCSRIQAGCLCRFVREI